VASIGLFMRKGFTLSELLVSLGILAVIAVFAIPKVLQNQQDKTYNSISKENIAAVSNALELMRGNGTLSPQTTFSDLTPYLNYVAVDSISIINNRAAGVLPNLNCSASSCLRLHNGAIIIYNQNLCFAGSAPTNAITWQIDPNGREDAVKGLRVFIYYNGKIRTDSTIEANTQFQGNCGGGVTTLAGPTPPDPDWFSWD
jgi:prepilin-type N-terminal cleavage/methylation domain-containing protein